MSAPLHPAQVRIGVVLDNFSPHISADIRAWAADHNVELAFVPSYASWLNRLEAQFQALRYFTLDGTHHESHEGRQHPDDPPLHRLAEP